MPCLQYWSRVARVTALSLLLCGGATAPAYAADAAKPALSTTPYPGAIQLQVDATDIQRRILQVKEVIPVQPGPLTLLFARWLPGQHGPYGNVLDFAGLSISTDTGATVPWQRDPLDTHAFRVTVPPNTQRLLISAQSLTPALPDGGRVVMTPKMLNLQWQAALLYPAGYPASAIPFDASVKVPSGWQIGSALRPVAGGDKDWQRFERVSLEQLIDSPVYAGRYVKRIVLDDSAGAPVALHLVGDNAKAIEASDKQIQAHRELVTQADKLFGVRHFQHYDFLLAISEELSRIGLEHHQSSENGVGLSYFKDWDKNAGSRGLLPHEYVHSWNGKYRRPADLWTPHFNTPMQNSLLWVYEGQTQFWGRVLAARSGLESTEQAIDGLAQVAATYQGRSGRAWRSLQDTTNEGTMQAKRSGKEWHDWQRSADYYDESALIWLDVDSLLRERTQEQKGMDDFARLFFGGTAGELGPQTYRLDDVVATLQQLAPYDWAGFLQQRLNAVGSDMPDPLAGLTRAGWALVWKDEQNKFAKADDVARKTLDFSYSLGLRLALDGRVQAVNWNSPAFQAGLTRASSILAVQGDKFSAENLLDALKANREGAAPIELLVKDGDHFRTVRIDYRGGPRYPYLQRVANTPDRLSPLLTRRP